MNAKKCNRCSNFFDITDNHLMLKIEDSEDMWVTPEFNIDLCEKCKEDFYDFLEMNKEVGEDEEKQNEIS